ncbi:MAG TPA: amino acid ABC transporter permease [Candidatus Borkfalkia avistercoris]|uniref:Amino acid ABC transporter permease n=1 Tax=Candidatus Borkfalkia avistercoris TaxID=2838504 RepID=A0A9D2CYM7_9FIRM|nr:amino acid ABC transporter permease [Candidatus Borkfalkia avistercoris]
MSLFIEVSLDLLKGFGVTCEIFFATLVCSLPLGLVLAFGSMSRFKPLRYVVKVFVWVIRGTPLMLQVIVMYFGPALLFGWGFLERILAVIIAFVINYSCYFSEIYRGGIESISKGQYEAGQVLGMTKTQIFFKVVLLQVIKRIIPPMSNEIITLVKDTSLARVIIVEEILKVAYDYAAEGLIWPLFYTAVYYLIFVGVLTLLFGFIEKKLNYFRV